MVGDATSSGARYWAFISYSHKDSAFGRRLHRKLEAYVLPRRIAGRTGLPRRLVPIFRDRDELPAAGDLSAEVRAALAQSRSLIVVCSPAAAASRWVSREVELFRELHPDRPILAAIREGEPADCFPEPLRRMGAGGAVVEPLAADFRTGQDGAGLGLLKLVAGIAGVGLDELVQRDAQRTFRRVTAVTAAALTAVLVMGALTIWALSARADAERQRAEAVHQRAGAEGLVDFMLTDLRDKLKGVGRLDVMATVNGRALQYYGDQNLSDLSPESLERRARVLMAMGEDDENSGHLDGALRKFLEARRTTTALLSTERNNPERIFDQSQNEFWIGTIEYGRGHKATAMQSFLAYKHLTDQLVALQPDNPKYRREEGYADGNLCSVDLRDPADPKAAVRHCRAALAEMEASAGHLPATTGIDDAIVNRHAWLADAYLAAGDIAQARSERLIEESLLDRQLAADPTSMKLKDIRVSGELGLARIEIAAGRPEIAIQALRRARASLVEMIKFDPSNAIWKTQKSWIETELSRLHQPAQTGD